MTSSPNEIHRHYYKLPFVGPFMTYAQHSIKRLTQRYCKNLVIKLVFAPYKIKNLFSAKDAISLNFLAQAVAPVMSVRQTDMLLPVFMNILSDKKSHIFQHIHGSETCRDLCSENCFSILDTAFTPFQLEIKEALHIGWGKPSLNKQVNHVNLSLSF